MRPSGGDELSRSLRAFRREARIDQIPAAAAAGISQSKLSRAERGEALLSPQEVQALAKMYRLSQTQQRRLIQLAEDAQSDHVDARVILQVGAHHFQQRIAALERSSQLVRSFQGSTILGVLQTEAYASIALGDESAAVAARMERGRNLSTGRWHLLMTEGALRWTIGSPDLMVEQLNHVSALSRLANVQLGLIPWATVARVFPGEAFHVYDDRAVLVGIETGTTIMEKPHHVSAYEALFGEFEKLAVYDDAARDLLAGIAEDYRTM